MSLTTTLESVEFVEDMVTFPEVTVLVLVVTVLLAAVELPERVILEVALFGSFDGMERADVFVPAVVGENII